MTLTKVSVVQVSTNKFQAKAIRIVDGLLEKVAEVSYKTGEGAQKKALRLLKACP